MQKDVLVLGVHAPEIETLRGRLARLGCRTVAAKTPDVAEGLLRVGGTRIGCVVVPSDLPCPSLRHALDALRREAPAHELTFLGAGREPGAEGRARMREAGVRLAIFDPVDTHTLRFQLNRAQAASRTPRCQRRTVRAPADWPFVAVAGGRSKSGRVYSVSASGAFLVVDAPWLTKTPVSIDLALPSGPLALSARVVMTNVPGNVMRRSLPIGMGVRFESLSDPASLALLVYAQERFRELSL
jgi:PilZ domain